METKRFVLMGVGGQGNLLAARLVGQAAVEMDIPVLIAEVHGMAQRGGIVEVDVVLGPSYSPIVSNYEADVLVSFEPMEALRALSRCNENTIVVTNTAPYPPFTVAIGQGVYPPVDQMLDIMATKAKRVIAINGNQIAEDVGNPLALNMVMLGALIGTGVVPIADEQMRKVIEASTKKAFFESNMKAYELGMKAAV